MGHRKPLAQENSYRPDLHSLDFIDANTGCVVAEENSYPGQTARIFRTLDGGAHWEKMAELANKAVDQLRFVGSSSLPGSIPMVRSGV